jgi:hypothetical protein
MATKPGANSNQARTQEEIQKEMQKQAHIKNDMQTAVAFQQLRGTIYVELLKLNSMSTPEELHLRAHKMAVVDFLKRAEEIETLYASHGDTMYMPTLYRQLRGDS